MEEKDDDEEEEVEEAEEEVVEEVEDGGGRWTTRGRGGREGCRGGGEGLFPEWDESGGEASYFVRSVHCPNLPPCIFFSLDSRVTPSSATRLNTVTRDYDESIPPTNILFCLPPLLVLLCLAIVCALPTVVSQLFYNCPGRMK